MKELKAKLEIKKETLSEKLIPKEIKGIWENPQTLEKREISLNIYENIASYKEFYKKHLNLELTKEQEREIKRIWSKNRKEIKNQIETYGYDEILIIPENIPNAKILNERLIETMEDEKGKVAETYKSENFKEGGGFEGLKNTEKQKTRIILAKNVQNTYNSGDPIVEATINKDIIQITDLTKEEAAKRIKNQEPLSINFKETITDKNGNKKEIHIQAEGCSLEEYIIFQRKYFDGTTKHLDENGWGWLLKSFSGARVVDSYWVPGGRELFVDADYLVCSLGFLGCRPFRSFSN